MDWISSVLYLLLMSLKWEAYGVRLNPFGGFSDSNFDQIADFSINQGAYLPNLPMASYYPSMMNDNTFNTMSGFTSLNPQMVPFINPLSPTLPQISLPPPRQTAKKGKNNMSRTPNNKNSHPPRNGQGPPKNRGVTLDVTGGGYRMEQQQSSRPYRAPVAESSIPSPQRVNSGRNNGGNSARPHSGPPPNRKSNQRPKGPSIKNPHYNGKFESLMASKPPNVEFVDPKNVLPFHPRVYKQFLQRNKQFGTEFQNMNKQKRTKTQPRNPNVSSLGSYQGNSFNPPKMSPKTTRNRGNPFASPIAAPQSFSPNFQIPEGPFPNMQTQSQQGFYQQPTDDTFQNNRPLYTSELLNQDPSFYAMLSQTSEGRAVLNQMQQQMSTSSANQKSPQTQFTNVPSPQVFMNLKAQYTGQNPLNYGGEIESSNVPGPQQSFPKSYIENQGNIPTQKAPNPAMDYQQMMMYYQQQQSQQQQQNISPKNQYGFVSAPSYQSTNKEPAPIHASRPSHQQNQQRQPLPKTKNSPYPETQYIQNPPYQESQGSGAAYANPYSNTKPPYEDLSYSNSFQASQKQVNSQISDIQTASPPEFTLPPYSPTDPLASADNNQDIQDYYAYQQTVANLKSPSYSSDERPPHSVSSALHEISPYGSDEKKISEYEIVVQKDTSKSHSSDSPSGYMTPEQLLAPHPTGLQSDIKYSYSPVHVESSHSSSSSSLSQESNEDHIRPSLDENHGGRERAALHLPEDVSIYVARQTENPYVYEYTEAYDPFPYETPEKTNVKHQSSEQTEVIPTHREPETDDTFHERIKELHKLLTKAPKNSYMVNPTESMSLRTTTVPSYKKDKESGDMKNHKNSHHPYVYQYSPSEKQSAKASPTWLSWKGNASRYQLQLPDTKPHLTTSSTTTTTTTSKPTTTSTTAPSTTSESSTIISSASSVSYYADTETPVCARFNNLTYCLQDPEYPKTQIKEAIERNRHPLDHFLVDISASSNIMDDNVNKLFENSVPLQSTSVSYSSEGKAIASTPSEISNSTGCTSNIYYAKPLRAINTAGQWKIIVNVEFEETGANYTQTVRIEECNYSYGFVATCGTETISACLQQYKLYRLLAWEPHRGFYIDAFLLPISCFCGSQETNSR